MDGRASLQAYCDTVLPPLNSALNTLAALPSEERPSDAVVALAALLGARGGGKLVPSKDLCSLLGVQQEALTADALVSLLIAKGAVERKEQPAASPGSPALVGKHPHPYPCEPDEIDVLGPPLLRQKSSATQSWQRLLKPALARGRSGSNPWAQYEIHKRPTEVRSRHVIIHVIHTSGHPWPDTPGRAPTSMRPPECRVHTPARARLAAVRTHPLAPAPPLCAALCCHTPPRGVRLCSAPCAAVCPLGLRPTHGRVGVVGDTDQDGAGVLCARRDARVLPDEEDEPGQRAHVLPHGVEGLQQLRRQALHGRRHAARSLLHRHQDADGVEALRDAVQRPEAAQGRRLPPRVRHRGPARGAQRRLLRRARDRGRRLRQVQQQLGFRRVPRGGGRAGAPADAARLLALHVLRLQGRADGGRHPRRR
eukprot:5062676-Prymnesium_polylepis.1